MPLQTAILGWGSLLWDDGHDFDKWHDDWRYDGPSLQLEFSRVSSSRLGALTLVVGSEHGVATTVAWCLSKRKFVDDAVADLRCREGCSIRHIGCLDLSLDADLPKHEVASIAEWGKRHGLDAVVWTALAANFEVEVKKPFSVAEAVAYIRRLPPKAKARAAEYMWRAPEFVRTPVRTALESEPWFHVVG